MYVIVALIVADGVRVLGSGKIDVLSAENRRELWEKERRRIGVKHILRFLWETREIRIGGIRLRELAACIQKSFNYRGLNNGNV